MSILKDNEFTEYEFTEDEIKQAYIFTDLQIQGLRTTLSEVASQKLELNPDGMSDIDFKLRHQYYAGKMDIIKGIISFHEQLLEIVQQQHEKGQR